MKVLLIRANRNEVDKKALADLGIDSVIDPYLDISIFANANGANRMLQALQSGIQPTWLVVTSTNALDYFDQNLEPGQLDAVIRDSKTLKYAAIGEQTAQLLAERGASKILTPRQSNRNNSADSQSLAEVLCGTPKGLAVIPAGSIAMAGLSQELRASGFDVITEVVYQTHAVTQAPSSVARISAGEIDAVLLRSPSAARAFSSFIGDTKIPIFCAGKTTATQAESLGLEVIAVSPDPSPSHVAKTIFEKAANHD